MADFMIRFFLCNVFLSVIIFILLLAKRILKNVLSSRMQYNMWFLLLGLLTVPFLPFRLTGLLQIGPWFNRLKVLSASSTGTVMEKAVQSNLSENTDWINDFALSTDNESLSIAGYFLLGIWLLGILAILISMFKSSLRLRTLEKSALPLQSPKVRKLYNHCLEETKIRRTIPVNSSAFLKSPMIVGLLKPRIYLPIHLISDCSESDIRYMLLHELQHYKHQDAIVGYLMNLAATLYWFNPLVWYARKEMRNDREVACDTSVLNMLEKDTYKDYGNTLINFAEKVSLAPFPFAAGLGGNMKQMSRRIANIASYEKPTSLKKVKGITAFILISILLFGFTPFLSTYAADESHYQWDFSSENISYVDLSAYFEEYEGSFVLYDSGNDTWNIYDMEHATMRVAPNSTYKIYDALFGLEEGIITPEDSLIPWNGETYPFTAWNADQTLSSAMSASVNWYFQAIDEQLGSATLFDYIEAIGYGNQNINGSLSSYWMESSLKISPVEQVELLIELEDNHLGFSSENINALNDAIRLSTSKAGTFYGKTGTGRVKGEDVNGWFVGFVETTDSTYFFATNIEAKNNATGSNAAEITMSILSGMNIWK